MWMKNKLKELYPNEDIHNQYEKDLANFFDNTGSFEEGKCCEELEKRLNKVCFG